MAKTLLKNGKLVNEGKIQEVDILLDGELIVKIASNISDTKATVIDVNGNFIIPGIIDDQVHFREPGLTHKGGQR
jgi:dihydroorotase